MNIPKCCAVVPVDIFDSQVGVLAGTKSLKKLIKMNDMSLCSLTADELMGAASGNGCALSFTFAGRRYYLIVMNVLSYRVVVHESCHAADFILSDRGIPLDVENTEIRAYLTDHIFQGVCGAVGLAI